MKQIWVEYILFDFFYFVVRILWYTHHSKLNLTVKLFGTLNVFRIQTYSLCIFIYGYRHETLLFLLALETVLIKSKMQQAIPSEEEVVHIKKSYTYQDLLKFQNPDIYSSIGKMKVSTMRTEPSMSFGTASRDKQQKIFQSKELCKSQFIGWVIFNVLKLQAKPLQAPIMKSDILISFTTRM